jgi:hypothetical protein
MSAEWGGKHNLCFPNEVIWLMGAPGSGKGTNTPAIMRARGITNPYVPSFRVFNLINTGPSSLATCLKSQRQKY